MKILTEKPPCFDRLQREFGIRWESGIVITYGAEVYCCRGSVSPDLEVHEQVHVEQQKGKDPEKFLEKFITDKKFRLEMELPAFKAQAEYLKKILSNDPSLLFQKLERLRQSMANNYKGMVTYEEAQKLI